MFKKAFVSLLTVGLLSSCDISSAPGADGYSFGQKQYVKNSVQIDVVEYSTRQSFNKELARRRLSEDVVAFAVLSPPYFNRCTIHMVDPSIEYVPEFMGHELAHCLYGQWHTSNNSKS